MDLLDRLIDHDAWATDRLLRVAAGLDEADWTRRFEIGPGSLERILLHVIGCRLRWADRIGERPLRSSIEDREHASATELIDLNARSAEDLGAVLRSLRDAGRLDEPMEFAGQDASYRFTRGTAAAHVLTHGMHHRAQVFQILRRLGVEPGIDGDVIEWEIAEHPKIASAERVERSAARLEIVEHSERRSVVALAGAFDAYGVDEVDAGLLEATAGRGRDTILDLSRLEFIASLGIGLLVRCATALKRRGARLVIVCPAENPGVRTVLDRGRLDAIAEIVPDLTAAAAGS